ncbi:MAG: hypothetical protein Kilf2KO_42990 [Rhodospirillales bacterium]
MLDASGSMWAQIDGDHKITVARSVLNQVLDELPADRALGFMAYGHRQKGVCSDIELLVPPAPGTAADVRAAAAKLNPKGKTPLSDAVRQAAEALRYTEEAATVVLITDGLETCDADPCAFGRALEESGVDFTAHVVGFGLKAGEGAQIACLAEATGGRYIDAASAAELTTALTETVAAPPPKVEQVPAAEPTATVTAPAEVPAGAPFEVSWDGPDARGDYIAIVEVGAPEGTYSNPNYTYTREGSPLTLRAPDALGKHEVRYVSGDGGKTLGSQSIVLTEIFATLEIALEIPAGSVVEAAWTGPGYRDDYLTLVEAGAPEGTYESYGYARDGSPTKLTAPDALGDYELRYVVGQSKRTLASHPVILVGIEASLDAPAELPAGAAFEVTWSGPDNPNDYVTIVEAGAPEGTYESYAYTRKGSPAKLVAPDGLGAYELRYVMGKSKRTLASRPVNLVEVQASLEAPADVPAGAAFEVTWNGPDNPNDYITIVEAGAPEGRHESYAYTRKGSPAKLVAPDGLGAYELRYVMGKSKRTLTSRPVTLVAVQASLEGPADVPAGATFEVVWKGPDNPNDYVTIVEAGAPEGSHESYAYTRKGSPAKLIAPDGLGAYELRYVMGKSKRTLVSRPLVLTPISASLELLNKPQPGGTAKVTWEGPGHRNDYIALAEPGAPEGKYLTYRYTRQGNPVTLAIPQVLGTYELRYVVGQSKRTLASLAVTLAVSEVSLEAPETVKAGGTLQVSWRGPGNWEDFIEIHPAGAPDKTKPLAATRTSQGSPLPIFAPGQAGDYEVRYVMRETGEVAARRPLTVE